MKEQSRESIDTNGAILQSNGDLLSAEGEQLQRDLCIDILDIVDDVCYGYKDGIDTKRLSRLLYIPEGVKHIDKNAFNRIIDFTCWIMLPDSLESIGENAFCGCKITNMRSDGGILFGKGLKKIGEGAFSHCYIQPILEIPDSVEEIGPYAFYSAHGLQSVTIGGGVKTISEFAFSYCRLRKLTIKDGVEVIGPYAFKSCDLDAVIIPSTVEEIRIDAFSENYRLKEVVVKGHGVKVSIKGLGGAFNSCCLSSRSEESIKNSMKPVVEQQTVMQKEKPKMKRNGFFSKLFRL